MAVTLSLSPILLVLDSIRQLPLLSPSLSFLPSRLNPICNPSPRTRKENERVAGREKCMLHSSLPSKET